MISFLVCTKENAIPGLVCSLLGSSEFAFVFAVASNSELSAFFSHNPFQGSIAESGQHVHRFVSLRSIALAVV